MTLTEDRLSTAPSPVEIGSTERRRRTPGAWVRFGWRRLTSMRTALQLLFVLSLGAVPGGLLPQRGQTPQAVTDYIDMHRTLGPLLDRLSLFDVFAAPWFAAVYLLLFISLIGCLGPRIRLHARALRRPPPATPSRLQRFAAYTSWVTDAPAEQVARRGAALLRGWRLRADARSVSAERGYLRETGNLVFHVALVLLLAGIGLGSAFGYESNRLLVEGEAFTNTRTQLDAFRPGRLVSERDLVPWRLRLDAFDATYQPNGTPRSFDARMTFTPAGGGPRSVDVAVNHPLDLGGGQRFYLLNHGYAPTFRLTAPDGTVTTDQAICRTVSPQTGLAACSASFAGLSRGPGGEPQDLALDATLAPTGVFDPQVGLVSSGPALADPSILVQPLVGNLGRTQLDTLDRRLLTPVQRDGTPLVANLLVNGGPVLSRLTGLPGGYTLDVERIDEWASFQVKDDPAKRLVLLAAVLVVAGLLLSLRVRRRRVWLRGTPRADGSTLVEVAGLARSDAPASRAELDSLIDRLRREVPPAPVPPAPGQEPRSVSTP